MDKKISLCLVSSGVELMTLTQKKFSCPFQSTDSFPEWKLALTVNRPKTVLFLNFNYTDIWIFCFIN
jgi:hypothetical protein